MEKIITTIATQLLSKLSKDRKYYTQTNLSDYGFPQFLIKRITFHLVRELSNEFSLPGEEWLNRESDELLAEWTELQRTIKREIHLPVFLAEEIIKKSVKECVGMTIQPRKMIPELLFEDHYELDSIQLTERSSAITVNRFLVWSMIRYMEKKNRESLNITDAARILESIESKIVENYHPLNWLSLVKPLFELSGSTVHSDLFRRFFEHKGKNHLAKEFDLIDDEIKESRFIEILSSPNSIHVEGYKDDQQTLFQEDVESDAVEAEDPMEDLIENQDEIIEDTTNDTPIFQSFREEPLDESEEWEEDTAEELVLDADEESEEEQISVHEEDDEDIEEEDVKENLAIDAVSESSEEEVEEEKVSKLEENVADGDERIEDLTDDTSIFQSFREESEEESEELEEYHEEELMLETEEDVEEGSEEEPVSVLEEDDEEIEEDDDTEEDDVFKNLDIEDKSEPKVEDIKDEQTSEPEMDHSKTDIQDEELKAPWEDEEEEDLDTFIKHDDEEDDTPVSELNDLFEEEQDGTDDEDQEEIIEDESVISKKEESVSDAALLEIEDEEIEETDSEDDEADSEDDEGDEGHSSLLNRFMFDDTDGEDTLGEMGSDGDKKVTTIYDELNLVRNDVKPETMDLFGTLETPEIEKKPFELKPDDKNQDSEPDGSDNIRKFSDLEESESEEDSSDSEVPMWRSFLERDENEAKSAFQFDVESEADEGQIDIEDSDEKLDEDGFIEEPIYDFTKREVDLDEKIGDLSNWMKDVREKFIEDLFGDSEDAYEQALSDIMEFDDWKNASKYIEKEIFTRNRIDVYDEIAVDFTDRLHSYFIENKS